MENYSKDLKDKIEREAREPRGRLDNRGRVVAGSILVIIGGFFLAREYGLDIPVWIFSWGTLLVALGLFVGAKHSFRGFGWLVPIAIGTFLLVDSFLPELEVKHYMWPLVIIAMGLFMIFRPRHHRRDWSDWAPTQSSDDMISSTNVFGGTRKTIISKSFKGGEITTVFGGCDINFAQADIDGTASIEITQVFGGTKLIIPAHWHIKSDVVCIFGGIEDKRPQTTEVSGSTKILKLDGVCVFGGIEIKSF